MDAPLVSAKACDVRALIAHLILGDSEQRTIGAITLAPHQSEAVARVKRAFAEFGGAFLCDTVGSGKTYVALALVKAAKSAIVIAPASLREMWKNAMQVTGIRAGFVSTESLSRSKPDIPACDVLVVDEAHHFRNASSKRYTALALAARGKKILLVTATPIHNSRRDFENLAAIFLGARARHLSSQEMTRLVIRREQSALSAKLPAVRATEWIQIRDDETTIALLERLPPPVPERDAGEASTLVTHGLIRQWASSEAALISALKRRRTRATALRCALEAGGHPSVEELRTWIAGEDAIQLGFPGMFPSDSIPDRESLVNAVGAHASALTALLDQCRLQHALDDDRASALMGIARAHPTARIVAFSSYEATVAALFERLIHVKRIACLTSAGARVAGGRITRSEAVSQFDPAFPDAGDSDRIDLLLTTDLLSEGVNLQRANVIVHLDIPWTAARLEQRVGRIARVGSPFDSVFVFGLKPPASAERALRAAALVSSKWMIAGATVGSDRDPGLESIWIPSRSTPETHEAIRSVLTKWNHEKVVIADATLVAAVQAKRKGFLALLSNESGTVLVCDRDGVTDAPVDVLHVTREAAGPDAHCEAVDYANAINLVAEWTSKRRAQRAAGIDDGVFLRGRRSLFAKMESLAANSSLHARIQKAEIAARVRTAAIATLGVEDEREMMAFDQLDTGSAENWFRATGAREERMSSRDNNDEYRIRALLLLVAPTAATSASYSPRSNTEARSPRRQGPRDPLHR